MIKYIYSPINIPDGVVDGASEFIDDFKVVVVIGVVFTSAEENRTHLGR